MQKSKSKDTLHLGTIFQQLFLLWEPGELLFKLVVSRSRGKEDLSKLLKLTFSSY